MSPDTTDDEGFTALHSACLADDGTPSLSEPFLRYLDHTSSPGAKEPFEA